MNDDDRRDTKLHRDIDNAFIVLSAKYLLPREEFRDHVKAFIEADEEEERERETRAAIQGAAA